MCVEHQSDTMYLFQVANAVCRFVPKLKRKGNPTELHPSGHIDIPPFYRFSLLFIPHATHTCKKGSPKKTKCAERYALTMMVVRDGALRKWRPGEAMPGGRYAHPQYRTKHLRGKSKDNETRIFEETDKGKVPLDAYFSIFGASNDGRWTEGGGYAPLLYSSNTQRVTLSRTTSDDGARGARLATVHQAKTMSFTFAGVYSYRCCALGHLNLMCSLV